MQRDQGQRQISKELVQLLGIVQPADEIEVAGSTEKVRANTRQRRQYIAVVHHAQAEQAGQGKAEQRAKGQPTTERGQARFARLLPGWQQPRKTARTQWRNQQAQHQQGDQAVAQPDVQQLGIVATEVDGDEESGEQPVKQAKTLEGSHDGNPLDRKCHFCKPTS